MFETGRRAHGCQDGKRKCVEWYTYIPDEREDFQTEQLAELGEPPWFQVKSSHGFQPKSVVLVEEIVRREDVTEVSKSPAASRGTKENMRCSEMREHRVNQDQELNSTGDAEAVKQNIKTKRTTAAVIGPDATSLRERRFVDGTVKVDAETDCRMVTELVSPSIAKNKKDEKPSKPSVVSRRLELGTADFFEFLFSDRWKEGCLLRILKGKLLDNLLHVLNQLEKYHDIISFATIAYIYSHKPVLPCIHTETEKENPDQLVIVEKVLVELDFFCPQERPESVQTQLQMTSGRKMTDTFSQGDDANLSQNDTTPFTNPESKRIPTLPEIEKRLDEETKPTSIATSVCTTPLSRASGGRACGSATTLPAVDNRMTSKTASEISVTGRASLALPDVRCNIRGLIRPPPHNNCLRPYHMQREPFLLRRKLQQSAFPVLHLPEIVLKEEKPKPKVRDKVPAQGELYSFGPQLQDGTEVTAPDPILCRLPETAEGRQKQIGKGQRVKEKKKKVTKKKDKGKSFSSDEEDSEEPKLFVDAYREKMLMTELDLMNEDLVAHLIPPKERKQNIQVRLKNSLKAKALARQLATGGDREQSTLKSTDKASKTQSETSEYSFNFLKKWDKCPAFKEFYQYLIGIEGLRPAEPSENLELSSSDEASSVDGKAAESRDDERQMEDQELETHIEGKSKSKMHLKSDKMISKHNIIDKVISEHDKKYEKEHEGKEDDVESKDMKNVTKKKRKQIQYKSSAVEVSQSKTHHTQQESLTMFEMLESLRKRPLKLPVKKPRKQPSPGRKATKKYRSVTPQTRSPSVASKQSSLNERQKSPFKNLRSPRLTSAEIQRMASMGITPSGTQLLTDEQKKIIQDGDLIISSLDPWHISVRFAYLAGGVCDSIGVRNDLLKRRERIYKMIADTKLILEINESRLRSLTRRASAHKISQKRLLKRIADSVGVKTPRLTSVSAAQQKRMVKSKKYIAQNLESGLLDSSDDDEYTIQNVFRRHLTKHPVVKQAKGKAVRQIPTNLLKERAREKKTAHTPRDSQQQNYGARKVKLQPFDDKDEDQSKNILSDSEKQKKRTEKWADKSDKESLEDYPDATRRTRKKDRQVTDLLTKIDKGKDSTVVSDSEKSDRQVSELLTETDKDKGSTDVSDSEKSPVKSGRESEETSTTWRRKRKTEKQIASLLAKRDRSKGYTFIPDSEIPEDISPEEMFKLLQVNEIFNVRRLKSSYSFEKMYAHRPNSIANYSRLLAKFQKPFKQKSKPKEISKRKQKVEPTQEPEEELIEVREPSPPPFILGKLKDFKFLQYRDYIRDPLHVSWHADSEMSLEEIGRLLRLAMQMFVVRKERATTLFGTSQYASKVTLTFTKRAPGDGWVGVPPMTDCGQMVSAVCKTLRTH